MRRRLPGLVLAVLCLGGASAFAASASPASRANGASPRIVLRAAFVSYLGAPHRVGLLEPDEKEQLSRNLSATFEWAHPTLAEYARDAALLLQVKFWTGTGEAALASRFGFYGMKRLLNWKAPRNIMLDDVSERSTEVELGRRYDAQLVLRRKNARLVLEHVAPDGTRTEATAADLPIFDIRKPKHFARILEKEMQRLAHHVDDNP